LLDGLRHRRGVEAHYRVTLHTWDNREPGDVLIAAIRHDHPLAVARRVEQCQRRIGRGHGDAITPRFGEVPVAWPASVAIRNDQPIAAAFDRDIIIEKTRLEQRAGMVAR